MIVDGINIITIFAITAVIVAVTTFSVGVLLTKKAQSDFWGNVGIACIIASVVHISMLCSALCRVLLY